MAKEFSLARIKSILEYNLRQAKVRGFEYVNGKLAQEPTGKTGLKPDASLESWLPGDKLAIPGDPSFYALRDNNVNLRDAIARTIFDVLAGSTSSGAITAQDESNYEAAPSNGNNSKDGSGIYLEQTSGPMTFKVGSNTVVVTDSSVTITTGSTTITATSSSITLVSGGTTMTIDATGVSVI